MPGTPAAPASHAAATPACSTCSQQVHRATKHAHGGYSGCAHHHLFKQAVPVRLAALGLGSRGHLHSVRSADGQPSGRHLLRQLAAGAALQNRLQVLRRQLLCRPAAALSVGMQGGHPRLLAPGMSRTLAACRRARMRAASASTAASSCRSRSASAAAAAASAASGAPGCGCWPSWDSAVGCAAAAAAAAATSCCTAYAAASTLASCGSKAAARESCGSTVRGRVALATRPVNGRQPQVDGQLVAAGCRCPAPPRTCDLRLGGIGALLS
jgi:hypothetical protein